MNSILEARRDQFRNGEKVPFDHRVIGLRQVNEMALRRFGPPIRSAFRANLLAERIRLIRKTLPVHGDVETYQKWVKAVARYSFETYHRFSGD